MKSLFLNMKRGALSQEHLETALLMLSADGADVQRGGKLIVSAQIDALNELGVLKYEKITRYEFPVEAYRGFVTHFRAGFPRDQIKFECGNHTLFITKLSKDGLA